MPPLFPQPAPIGPPPNAVAVLWAAETGKKRAPIVLPPGVTVDARELTPEQFDALAKQYAPAPAAAPAVRAKPLTPADVATLVRRSSGGKP